MSERKRKATVGIHNISDSLPATEAFLPTSERSKKNPTKVNGHADYLHMQQWQNR